MTLVWKRTRDGGHFGKPVYEYTANDGDREFCVVWASDYGGIFGYTAYRRLPDGKTEPLKERRGIIWSRTLKRCKAACEAINAACKAAEQVT